jgi:septal ring factor EnvC (AmiA/AmiB activator)
MTRRILPCFALLLVVAAPAAAQDARRDIRDSQLRLDSIRQERSRLQREMETLKTRVRDASREAANIAKQRAASAAALRELDLQLTLIGSDVAQTRAELDVTKQRLKDRAASLNSRLRSIYKRGPLHSVRVLLAAEDFSDVLSRYKYLHLITEHDQRVLVDVGRLEAQLAAKDQQLEQTLSQFENLRQEKSDELSQLRRVESQRQRTLADFRRAETRTAQELEKAESAEKGLATLIAKLEEERRRANGAGGEGSISTSDLGALNWPVEGQLIYRFGPVRKSSGVVMINKGIGIAAPAGTPVKAVEAGTVSIARALEGYGPSVLLDHGGGFYTLYMFLKSISVREGQRLVSGQVLGAVGGEQTPEGPHLFFQVRAPVQDGVPDAVDPLTWLRSRAASR